MKSRKWKKISALLFLGIALLFLLMPTYMQEALIHWFPDISDTYIFRRIRWEKLIPAGNGRWPGTPIDTG